MHVGADWELTCFFALQLQALDEIHAGAYGESARAFLTWFKKRRNHALDKD